MAPIWPALFAFSMACGVVACGGDDAPSGGEPDARIGEPFVDAAPAAGLPTTCDGDCAQMSMEAAFGVQRSFDRSFFGLTSPANSDSGEWEIYFEVNTGDDDKCPEVDSPTPDFILVVSGHALPTETSTHQDGTATIVDFKGELLTDGVFEEAANMSLTWVAADPCQACSEGQEPDREDRMIAYDLTVNFAGGMVSGHGYATHCASLDQI